ncbi:toxin YoeB [Arcicella aurantiaca]|uniref:Putative mRNA interferase YoeB n=1 Tax=Arcicella aurantiaca TaxID=591202 RepID=A0A316EGV8_9BACT|nr:Txe/YoeB family addiction module toxin [Arcicella aurantiaca]PWK27977.1 toxin YoeB [Arcicella aurantiaca]
MRKLVLEDEAQRHIQALLISEPKLIKKIFDLIGDVQKHPFEGIGKPEALKHELTGYWSRRITDKHRLVYQVTDDDIIIIRCKDHYDDK